MKPPLYMPLYPGDYHRDTYHLRAIEHGAYLLLLMALWVAGGKLPLDDAALASKACCSPEEWAAVKAAVLPLFQPRRGVLTHKRVTAELAKSQDKIGKASAAGKLSAAARAGKKTGNPPTDAQRPLSGRSSDVELTEQNRTELLPEDKSSGAAKTEGVDPDAEAWTAAIKVLTFQGGMSEPEARRFFGVLLARHKLQARDLLTATASAVLNQTRDPRAYLNRVAQLVAERKIKAGAKPIDAGFV